MGDVGPNHSGVGIGGRIDWFNSAITLFGFAGDTTVGLPLRPGGLGIIVEGGISVKITKWLLISGFSGYVARLTTYPEQESMNAAYTPIEKTQGAFSVGGMLQTTLASHVVLGGGYRWIFTTRRSGLEYDPLYGAVGAVGWQF